MQLTKSHIKQLIKEELRNVLNELRPRETPAGLPPPFKPLLQRVAELEDCLYRKNCLEE